MLSELKRKIERETKRLQENPLDASSRGRLRQSQEQLDYIVRLYKHAWYDGYMAANSDACFEEVMEKAEEAAKELL